MKSFWKRCRRLVSAFSPTDKICKEVWAGRGGGRCFLLPKHALKGMTGRVWITCHEDWSDLSCRGKDKESKLPCQVLEVFLSFIVGEA